MTKKFKKASMILLALFLAVACVCSIAITNNKAYADEETLNGFRRIEYVESGKYYDYKNAFPDNAYFLNLPTITVLTHGMGSDARVWSNDISADNLNNETVHFAYDEFSLIERLRSKSNALGNQVVRAVISSTDSTGVNEYSFELKKVELMGSGINKVYRTNEIDFDLSALDPTKHLIVIYDAGCMSDRSNEEDFKAFTNMLLSIVNKIGEKINTTDVDRRPIYPKINLIGHSRGGLTNLAFAMAYPELVYSLTSIGTPYFGSNFGRLSGVLSYLRMNEENQAIQDIQNEEKQTDMVIKWNAGYLGANNLPEDDIYNGLANTVYENISTPLYKKIKLKLLGGYMRTNYLKMLINSDYMTEFMNIPPTELENLKKFPSAFEKYMLAGNLVSGEIAKQLNAAGIGNGITAKQVTQVFDEAMFNNDMQKPAGNPFIFDDLFVSLNSQLGIRYNKISYAGFSDHTHYKYFSDLNNIQEYKFAQFQVPIVHNLETRDPFFVNEIVYGTGNAGNIEGTGNEIDEATDMGMSMGKYRDMGSFVHKCVTNMEPAPFDGRDIKSDAVIVRSNRGVDVLTDDGYMSNHCDIVDMEWFFKQCSMSVDFATLRPTYDRIKITISGDVKEKDDGYQWIGIFNTSATKDSDKIAEFRTEHGSGVKDTKWSYTLNADFDLLLAYFSDGKIVLRYTGSGRQNDDWYCRNIKMTIKIYKWREVPDHEIVQ